MFYVYRKSSGEVFGVSTTSYGTLPSDLGEANVAQNVTLDVPYVYLASVLRQATAQEIAGFAQAIIDDAVAAEKEFIKDLFDNRKPGSIVVKAIMAVMLSELNLIRGGLTVPMPDRTAAQIRTALRNRIDAI